MRRHFALNILFTLLLNIIVFFLLVFSKIDKDNILQLVKYSVVPDSFFIGIVFLWLFLWIVCHVNQFCKNLFIEFSSLLKGIYISIAAFLLSAIAISIRDINNWTDIYVLVLLLFIYMATLLGGTLISFFSDVMVKIESVIKKISIIILIVFGSFIYWLLSYYVKIILTSHST